MCGRRGAAPCARCVSRIHPAGPVASLPGLDAVWALVDYVGPAREVVARLKYRNERSSIPWLASGMAALVRAGDPGPDLVTWLPTTATRRRDRGFDQAELLARAVARRGRWPMHALLVREAGPAQTGRNRRDRARGPTLAVRPRCTELAGRRVLVVDDVLTTGASLIAAARALRRAGAASVVAVTAAHTPARVRLPSPVPSPG